MDIRDPKWRWNRALLMIQAKYPICWKLFGKLAIERLIRLPKKYVYDGWNEYELIEDAMFMPNRKINKSLKKGV